MTKTRGPAHEAVAACAVSGALLAWNLTAECYGLAAVNAICVLVNAWVARINWNRLS